MKRSPEAPARDRRSGGSAAGPAESPGSAGDDKRLDLLFETLRDTEAAEVSTAALRDALSEVGLRASDPRLRPTHHKLRELEAAQHGAVPLDRARFEQVLQGNASLLERAIRRELAVPDFGAFARGVEAAFEATRGNAGGEVAGYIPQLSRVDPELYGLGLCTVDGQRLALGDAREPFCVQSSCKPFNYCLALADAGAETVHRHVGCEPSGRSFNELALNHEGRPHNPMINAGAIMTCSLIGQHLEPADRFDHVTALWSRMAGGGRPGFANAVYLSERRTADRNFALAYSMRENDAFPAGADLHETLEFYFQCCSLETTADDFAVIAATLANGGVCPLTDERVLRRDVVQKCLTLMGSCGMYDFSGQWAFEVGLPAKSGVSGVIVVVVPGKLGFCVWSPRLDRIGNSVRGVALCRELVRARYLDELANGSRSDGEATAEPGALLAQLLWAASQDDLPGIRRAAVRGQALGAADYDGRTALHVAASEGRLEAVRYLLLQGVDVAPRDRWGGSPLDDARREGHAEVAAFLERWARERNGAGARTKRAS